MLQCIAVCCIICVTEVRLQGAVVCCSVLQCVAVCCTALQRVAACCSVLQSVGSVLQCVV